MIEKLVMVTCTNSHCCWSVLYSPIPITVFVNLVCDDAGEPVDSQENRTRIREVVRKHTKPTEER